MEGHTDADEHKNAQPAAHRSPSEITADRDLFDRFAARIAHVVSRGPFFFVCVVGVFSWILTGALIGFSDRWLGWGATCMGIAILLLVAILENAQRRSDQAVQRKLNAIADALAVFIAQTEVEERPVRELQSAVGLEHRESTSDSHVESVFRPHSSSGSTTSS